jgi:hypothetical protein
MNASHKMKLREIMSDRAAAECLEKISTNNSLLFTAINRKSLNCSGLLPYLTDRAICKLEYDRLKIIGERAGRGLYAAAAAAVDSFASSSASSSSASPSFLLRSW